MVKPPLRTKSIGFKVSEEEYARHWTTQAGTHEMNETNDYLTDGNGGSEEDATPNPAAEVNLDTQLQHASNAPDGAQQPQPQAAAAQAAQNNQQTRADVAATAEKYNGSTDWGFSKQKGAFACNTNKCNAFVGDVTKEAGAPASVTGSDGKSRYPLAAEWADKNTKIADWRVLGKGETPEPGDVAAYKLSGGGASYSGHSGIVTSVESNGVVHGMAAHENVVGPDDKFNSTPTRTVTYRRYTGDD
jgi:hypothetical protein